MGDAQFQQRVKAIADAIEYLWLRGEGAMRLLELAKVPGYWETVEEYTAMEANKALAHDRFLEVTALLRILLRDSEALDKLSTALMPTSPKSKPN